MKDFLRSLWDKASRLGRVGLARPVARAAPAARADARGVPARGAPPGDHRAAAHREAPAGGRFAEASFGNEAGSRAYKLYLPGGPHREALPLVVMLHGCTQDPDDFATGTRMNEAAQAHGCIVLYPAQPKSANGSGCWNWFNAGDQQRGRGEPAILAGMTRHVMATQPVDPRRVYVAGLSAGGAMAATLAATYPELYAALGVHSGLAHGAANDLMSAFKAMREGPGKALPTPPEPALPTIVFHGDRDTTVHPRNGEQLVLAAREVARTPALAEAATSAIEYGQVPNGRAYTRTTYLDPGGQPLSEHWLVHGCGHAWSGGSSAGSYTDPQGPDASAQILRFFLQHRRND